MSFTTSNLKANTGLIAATAGAALLGGIGLSHFVSYACKGACPFAKEPQTNVSRCPYAGRKSGLKKPLVVTVTGAAGQIGYAILFQIAKGLMLGDDQPIELRLLEITNALPLLQGVVMELEDCAFPLLTKVVPTDDNKVAFEGCDIALLIGARPRGPGMTRGDLLKSNAEIFKKQGKALNDYASRDVKVLVVGNPANTNAKIAMEHAPSLPKTAFTAMTKLDEIRAVAQLAKKAGVSVAQVKNVIVWGNHSDTQYPDITFSTICKDGGEIASLAAIQNDEAWAKGDFIQVVQKRGGAIIDAMKKSSAASAANAAIQHIRSWVLGTAPGQWVSMAVCSNGEYGVPKDLIFSFPCTCKDGKYTIVSGLDAQLTDFARSKMKASWDQLVEEIGQVDNDSAAAASSSVASSTTAATPAAAPVEDEKKKGKKAGRKSSDAE